MESGMQSLSNKDLALLSAYLDGQLSEAEHQQLEKRLVDEPHLLAELESLQEVVHLANNLPRLKAPRDFTLDPARYGRTAQSATWTTKITRLNGWQLSSMAGLAATIVIISALVLTNNPFTSDDGLSDSEQKSDVARESGNDAELDASDEDRVPNTVIAILPTETFMDEGDGSARALPTDTLDAQDLDNNETEDGIVIQATSTSSSLDNGDSDEAAYEPPPVVASGSTTDPDSPEIDDDSAEMPSAAAVEDDDMADTTSGSGSGPSSNTNNNEPQPPGSPASTQQESDQEPMGDDVSMDDAVNDVGESLDVANAADTADSSGEEATSILSEEEENFGGNATDQGTAPTEQKTMWNVFFDALLSDFFELLRNWQIRLEETMFD